MNYLLIQVSITCLALQVLAQLLGRWESKRLALASLLWAAAVIQSHFLLLHSKQLLQFPHLFMSYVPLLLFLGPMIRAYFNKLSKDQAIVSFKNSIHFLLPLWGMYYYWSFWHLSDSELILLIQNLYQGIYLEQFIPISLLCSASLLLYAILILKEQPRFKTKDKLLNKPLLMGWFVINILFVLAITFSVFNATWLVQVSHIGNTLVSCVFIGIFLLNYRYPSIFMDWLFEVRKAERSRRYLGGIDPHETLARIKSEMKEQLLFTDSELSLQKLADHFKLTRYQLSELLNDYQGQSFHDFLASYRVSHAKHLLKTEPWKKTLTIGMEVGFNSQASFNKAFKKITGQTPSHYQKS